MGSNKFNLKAYDLIAIDMDNTLVKYKLKNVLPLVHRLINKHLIEKYNYSKDIEEDFCPKLCQKGLIIDKRRGNVLKLDLNYNIISAKHANHMLSTEEIDKTYGKINNQLTQITDYLNKGTINAETDFYVLKDYFTTPSAQIMAKIVEVMDNNNSYIKREYSKIWSDIYAILCQMYDKKSFNTKTGGFFQELQSKPNQYLEKSSQQLKQFLNRLRQNRKLVFLITSSNVDYTRFLMNHSFGHQWIYHFDCILTFARKPTFFTTNRPFLWIDNNDDIQCSVTFDELKCGQIYSEGNWNDLKSFVAKQTANEEPKCVYIGDSFNDDCIVPNKYVNCDTIAVVEELEESVRDELEPTYWQSFFVDDCNNTSLWYQMIKTHSKLIIANVDSLVNHFY